MTKKEKDLINKCFKNIFINKNRRFMQNKWGKQYGEHSQVVIIPISDVIKQYKKLAKAIEGNKNGK